MQKGEMSGGEKNTGSFRTQQSLWNTHIYSPSLLPPPQHTFFFQIHHYFTSIHTTIKDERLLYAVYKYLPRLFCLYSVTVLI